MLRNLAANLVTHERIETTEAKAKELRRIVERLITKAKRIGTSGYTPQSELSDEGKAKRLHVSRLLSSYLPRWGVTAEGLQVDLVEKILIALSKRFSERPGGYTRIIKLGPRRGDGAPMVQIEFVDAPAVQDKVSAPLAEEPVAAEAVAG